MVSVFQERGWLKTRQRQRTDATHVVAAARTLTRIEMVGETLRQAHNVLATVLPDWLQEQQIGMNAMDERLKCTEAELLKLAE